MADPTYDLRLTPARPDLAARHLQGKIEAARYADGEACEIVAPLVGLTATPSNSDSLITQALKGERVTIYDRPGNGWAWGQLARDGYVGWMPDHSLRWVSDPPNRKVAALRTFAFPSASIKIPPVEVLTLGATVCVEHDDGNFAITREGWFVPAHHLEALDHVELDFVAVAERFLGTPYLWGGKSGLGIDCSGLVQISLNACGIACLRDSDMQAAGLGSEVRASEIETLRRGDLVFWKGHVAIVRDAETFVHANAFHMMTAIEPIRETVSRIASAGSDITMIRRMS